MRVFKTKKKERKASNVTKGFINSTKDAKHTVQNITDTTMDMVTGLPKLPWKKLPLLGWLCIIGMLLFMIAVFFFLVPLTGV